MSFEDGMDRSVILNTVFKYCRCKVNWIDILWPVAHFRFSGIESAVISSTDLICSEHRDYYTCTAMCTRCRHMLR